MSTLKVDTITEQTTDAGVTIELVALEDGNITLPTNKGLVSSDGSPALALDATGIMTASENFKMATGKGLISSDGSPALAVGATGIMTAAENIAPATGKGIDFSSVADVSAGVDTGQLLADYEEGTWTPAFSGGMTGSMVNSVYVKVGDMVTISAEMRTLAGTIVQTFTISGLPYDAKGSEGGSATLVVRDSPAFTTMRTLSTYGAATSAISCYNDSGSALGAGDYLYLSWTYITA